MRGGMVPVGEWQRGPANHWLGPTHLDLSEGRGGEGEKGREKGGEARGKERERRDREDKGKRRGRKRGRNKGESIIHGLIWGSCVLTLR